MDKKLYCSPNKKLCGVCGGIADYLNIDPTIIRIIVALMAIYTAVIPVLLLYFIAALIIPKAPDNYYQLYNNTSMKLTKGNSKQIAGVCSGFAERLNCDATIVRLIFVLLVLLLGTGIIAYIACAIIMPEPFHNGFQDFQQNNNYYNND